jgi:transposase-like protein
VTEAADRSVPIKCPYCEKQFRAHQRFVRGGSTIECSACQKQIVFETTSEFAAVRKALIAARQLRLKHSSP